MEIKKLIGLLTIFEKFLSQLNKQFSSKKTICEIIWKFFFTTSKYKHSCVLQKHQKIETQLFARRA